MRTGRTAVSHADVGAVREHTERVAQHGLVAVTQLRGDVICGLDRIAEVDVGDAGRAHRRDAPPNRAFLAADGFDRADGSALSHRSVSWCMRAAPCTVRRL